MILILLTLYMPHLESLCISYLPIFPLNNIFLKSLGLHKLALTKNFHKTSIGQVQGILLQLIGLILVDNQHFLQKLEEWKNGLFCVSCFKNNFTMFVFDAAVWTGGTASLINVYSLPGLIATFTGVLLSMTLVSTLVKIIRSTFFCLSYPDQSCTNHKGQENWESLHLDDYFRRIECSKDHDFEFWKKKL